MEIRDRDLTLDTLLLLDGEYAATLLADFWAEVESILQKRNIEP
jgi:hypothetical protein